MDTAWVARRGRKNVHCARHEKGKGEWGARSKLKGEWKREL